MAVGKQHKLDLGEVLNALDRQDYDYYGRLTEEEKKGYTPLVLMRYMSSLNAQNSKAAYAVMMANDLVNIGFWNLSKHPELQHKLLCLTGIGGRQFRPWLAAKNSKKINKIDKWLIERFPGLNEDEIQILKSSHDSKTWAAFVKGSGASDAEVKEMIEAWKKQSA
jgi:hypothetical protein